MREIKFRVWNGEQMVSPAFITREGQAVWSENSIPTSSENIMQYTGLKDRNGKEIFEGDIVKHRCISMITLDVFFEILEVYFDEELLEFGVKNSQALFHCQFSDDFEVIGNIYENPELLDAEKEQA